MNGFNESQIDRLTWNYIEENEIDREKFVSGYRCGLKLLKEGLVGLSRPMSSGAGSTIMGFLYAIKEEGFDSLLMAGSSGTRYFIDFLGLKRTENSNDLGYEPLNIDGTMESDKDFNQMVGAYKGTSNKNIEGCMKGVKELARNSGRFIVLADESKLVNYLGEKNSLPIEVRHCFRTAAKNNINKIFNVSLNDVQRRMIQDRDITQDFITEEGNLIFDVPFDGRLFDGKHEEVNNLTLSELEDEMRYDPFLESDGLIANHKPDHVIVSYPDRVGILKRPR